MTLLLRNAVLPDESGVGGAAVDVLIVDGIIRAIGRDLAGNDGVDRHDLAGRLLLPAMAEPHAHLDKAFLAETVPNPTGDLMGAIMAMETHRGRITLADTVERAERAARLLAANGVTAIRTHVDTTMFNGLMSVEALVAVRECLRGLVDIQIVALTGWPSLGLVGADQRALLRDAIAAGVDLVGGCPHLERDAAEANDSFLSIAADAGLPLDLHTDETLDPRIIGLEHLARRVRESGFPHGVTAGHCISLGMQPDDRQAEVAESVAAANISVVALPHTNMFLQGRSRQTAMPRGITAVRALTAAGVNVAAGGDNLQDPFNPIGRGDPLETAGLMVMAAHLLPADAYASVSTRARRAMGLASNTVEVGGFADLVAVPAASIREAIAMGPGDRVVVKAGRVLSACS